MYTQIIYILVHTQVDICCVYIVDNSVKVTESSQVTPQHIIIISAGYNIFYGNNVIHIPYIHTNVHMYSYSGVYKIFPLTYKIKPPLFRNSSSVISSLFHNIIYEYYTHTWDICRSQNSDSSTCFFNTTTTLLHYLFIHTISKWYHKECKTSSFLL